MTRPAQRLELFALAGVPWVEAGADLAEVALTSLARSARRLEDGDVLVFAQKLVSKAEGRLVDLRRLEPGSRAQRIGRAVGKDPRLVELILSESRRVVRQAPGVLIVEHRLGFVMANAGVDQSNVINGNDDSFALPLPVDPDGSAERLRAELTRRAGARVGVIINDSFGRPWRVGTVGVAIGCAGLPAVVDRRGHHDLTGRTLKATVVGHADELAAAASLVMGQADEGQPIVLVRGLLPAERASAASTLVRPAAEDLFR